ncbi:uncharacterized protein LOC136030513 [Artemia franciscana]|uniref:C3H1-type domain-containing protein n=1 Tax=Artemia franciscana TaxID=6661 RepID=A0AA88KVX3_ARTSF|nr:hypothetical protein QYM36_015869 [Artemia franciscana]
MPKKLKKKDKQTKKKHQKLLKPVGTSQIKKKKLVSSRAAPCAKFKGMSKMIRVDFIKKGLPNSPKKLSVSAITSVASSSGSSSSPTKKSANKCGERSSSILEKSSIVKSGKAQVEPERNPNTPRKSPIASAKSGETPRGSQVSLGKGQGRSSDNSAFLSKSGSADALGKTPNISRGSATYDWGAKKEFKTSSIVSVMIPKPRCRSSLVQISQSSSSGDLDEDSVSNQAQKAAKNKTINDQSGDITNSIAEKRVDLDRTNNVGESDVSEFEDFSKNIESMPKRCSNQINVPIGSPNSSSGSVTNSEQVDFLKTMEFEQEPGTENENTMKHSKFDCETITTLHSRSSKSQSGTAVNDEQNNLKKSEASCRSTLERLPRLESATKPDRLDGMKDNEIDRHLKRGRGRPRSRLSSPLQKNKGADESKGQISDEQEQNNTKKSEASCRVTLERLPRLESATKPDRLDGMKDNGIDRHLKRGRGRPRSRLPSPLQKNNGADESKGQTSNELSNDRRSRSRSRNSRDSLIKTGKEEKDFLESSQRQSISVSRLSSSTTEIIPASSSSTHSRERSNEDDLRDTASERNTRPLRAISTTKEEQSRSHPPIPSRKNSRTSECAEEREFMTRIDQSSELEVVFHEGQNESEENENSTCSTKLKQVNTSDLHNQKENKRVDQCPELANSCENVTEIPSKRSTSLNVEMGSGLVPANNYDQVSNSLGDLRDKLVTDLGAPIQKEKLSNECNFLSVEVPSLKQVGNSFNVLSQKRRGNESPSPVRIRVNTGSRLSRREEFSLKKQINHSFKAYVKLEPLRLDRGVLSVSCLSIASLDENIITEFFSMAETKKRPNENINYFNNDTSVPERAKLADDETLVGKHGTNNKEDKNEFQDLCVSESEECDISLQTSSLISEESQIGSGSTFPLSKTNDEVLLKSILTPFPRKKSKSVSFHPHLELFPEESYLLSASSEVVDLSSDLGEEETSEPEAEDHKCLIEIEAICCLELEDSSSKIEKIKGVIKEAPKSAKYSKAFIVIGNATELDLPSDIIVNVTHIILKNLLRVKENVEPNSSILKRDTTEAGVSLKDSNERSESTVTVKVPREKLGNCATASSSHDSSPLSSPLKQRLWLSNIRSPEEKVTVSMNETPENVLLSQIEARLSRSLITNVYQNSPCSGLDGITPLSEYNLLHADSNLNSPTGNRSFDDSGKSKTTEEPGVWTMKETEVTEKLRVKAPSRVESRSFSEEERKDKGIEKKGVTPQEPHVRTMKEVATKLKEPLKLEYKGLVKNEGKESYDRAFYLQILRKIQNKKSNSKSEDKIAVEGKSKKEKNKDKPCYIMCGPRKILDDSIPLESISLRSLDRFDLSEKHKEMLLKKHKEWSILANADVEVGSHEHSKTLQFDEKSERRKGSHERQEKSKDVLDKKMLIQKSQETQKKEHKSRERILKRKHETSDSQENKLKKEKTASQFLKEDTPKRDESCSNKRRYAKDATRKKSRSRDKDQKSTKKQRIIEIKAEKHKKSSVVGGTLSTNIFLSPERPKYRKEFWEEIQAKKANSTDISDSPTISSPRTPDFTKNSESKSTTLFLPPTKISQKISPIVSKTALKIMHEKKLAEAERASKSESPTEVLSNFLDLAPLTVSGSPGHKDTLIIVPHPENLTPPKLQDLFSEHQYESVEKSSKGEITTPEIVPKMTDVVYEQAMVAIDITDPTEFREEKSASPVIEDTEVAPKDDGSMIAETSEDVTLQGQPESMLIDEEESSADSPETSDDSVSDLNTAAPTRTSTEAVEHPETEINTEGQSTTSEDELLCSPKQLIGEEKEGTIAERNLCRKDAGKEITEEEAVPRSDMVSTSVFDLAREPEPEPLDYEIDLEHEEELLDASDRQIHEEQRSTKAEEEQNNLSESPNNNTQVDEVPRESRKKICFSVLYYGECKKQETCPYIHDLVHNEPLLEKLIIQNYYKLRIINCLKIWKVSLEKGFLGQYNTYYSLVPMLNNRKHIDTKAFNCLLDHSFKLARSHDKDGEELIWAMYLFLKERHYICKSLVTKIVRMAIEIKMVYVLSDFLLSVLNPEDRVRLKPIFWQILLSLKDYFGCSEVSEVVSAISKINVQLLDFFATDVSIEKQCVLLTALLSRSRPSAGPPLPIQHFILQLRNSLPESLVSQSTEKINKPRVAPELLFIPPNPKNTQSHGKSAPYNPDVFDDVRNTDWERKVMNRQEQPLNMLQRQELSSKGRVDPLLEGYSQPNWLKKQYEDCNDNNALAGLSFADRGGFLSKRRKLDQVDTQAAVIETPSVSHHSSLYEKPFINSSANVLEENGYIKNLEIIRNKAKMRDDYSKFKLDDSELEMLNSPSVIPRPVAPVRPFPPRDLSMGRPYLLETPSVPPLYPVDHMNPPMKDIQTSTGETFGVLPDAAGTSNLNSREMVDIPPSTLGQDTTVQPSSSHFVFGQQIPKGFAFVRINNNRKPLGFSTDPDLNVGPVIESVSETGPTHTVDRLHPGESPMQLSPEPLESRTPYPAIDPARPRPSVAVPEPGPSKPNVVPSQGLNTLKDIQLGKKLSKPDSRTKVDEKKISCVDLTGDAKAPGQIKKDNVTVRKLFASVFGKPGENQPNFRDPEDPVTIRAMKTKDYKVVADRISRDPENTSAISAVVRGLCDFNLNAEGLSSILEELPEKVVKSPGIQKLCVAFTLELCRHKIYEELLKTCLLFKKHTIIYLSPDLMSPIHPSIEPHDILIELALGLVRKGEWRHAICILDKKMIQTRYMEKLIDNDRLKLLSQIIIKKVQDSLEAPLVKVRDLKSEIHQIVSSHKSATYVFITNLKLNNTDVTSLKDQLAPKFDVLRLFLSRKADSKIMLWRR